MAEPSTVRNPYLSAIMANMVPAIFRPTPVPEWTPPPQRPVPQVAPAEPVEAEPLPAGSVNTSSYLYQPARGVNMSVPMREVSSIGSGGAPRVRGGFGGNIENLPSRVMPMPSPATGGGAITASDLEGRARTRELLDAAYGPKVDPEAEAIQQSQQQYALERLAPADSAPRPAERWQERLGREEGERRRTALTQEMGAITGQMAQFFRQRLTELMSTPEYQRGDDIVRGKLVERVRADAEAFADRLEQRIIAREAALSGKVPGQYFEQ